MQNEVKPSFDLSKAVTPETVYTEREYTYENGEQILESVQQYDADGNMTVGERYSGGEPFLRAESSYIFLPDGKAEVAHVITYTRDAHGGWCEAVREYAVYEYDENGVLTAKTYYDESNRRPSARVVYDNGEDDSCDAEEGCAEHDEAGRIIREQCFDGNGNPAHLHTYEYGEAGQLLRRTIRFYPEIEANVMEDVYAYDGQNRQILWETYENGTLICKRVREYVQ